VPTRNHDIVTIDKSHIGILTNDPANKSDSKVILRYNYSMPEKANLPRGGDAKRWVCIYTDSQAAEGFHFGGFFVRRK
jgi:hypothetical protein